MDYIEEKFTIVKSLNYLTNLDYLANRWEDVRVGVRYRLFDLGRGLTRTIPITGSFFLRNEKSGEKLILNMKSNGSHSMSNALNVSSIIYDSENVGELNFWKEFLQDFYQNGLLRNECFGADLRLLDYDTSLTYDNIVLNKSDRIYLEKNIIGFIAALPTLEEAGLQTSRGIMLAGVPGTGKTLYCHILMNMVDMTVIYVTQARLSSGMRLSNIYKFAREMAPSMVILEDIDTIGGVDRRAGAEKSLGPLLEILEGIEPNSKVITIATTNFPEHLDEALRGRPGRIDAFLRVDLPGSEQRLEMLKLMLMSVRTKNNIDYQSLVKMTHGMTGAYLREVVASAIMSFTYANPKKEVILSNTVLMEACKETKKRLDQGKPDITYTELPAMEVDDEQAFG
jgi:SpoVK/Ycf46/Vps4 family AAA+-type ATPase